MRLNSLQLVNFRNYNNLYLEFNKKVNLLLGKNGQGKTNIVESIYMLSFGKSFRTSRDKEIIKFDTENLYVGGSFSKEHTDGLIEIAIGKNKKGIKVNKIHIQKIHELLGNLNVVIFSPEDLRLVKEGPKERRSCGRRKRQTEKRWQVIKGKPWSLLRNIIGVLLFGTKTSRNPGK